MTVNNNGNNATRIGVTAGTPGAPVVGAGGKPTAQTDNASLLSTLQVQPPPFTPPTNKNQQPPLPDKVSIMDLGEVAKGAPPGLLTIEWLRDNFRNWGETDGKNGLFFYLTAKNEGGISSG